VLSELANVSSYPSEIEKLFEVSAPYPPTTNSPEVIEIPTVLRVFIPKYFCDLLNPLSPR